MPLTLFLFHLGRGCSFRSRSPFPKPFTWHREMRNRLVRQARNCLSKFDDPFTLSRFFHFFLSCPWEFRACRSGTLMKKFDCLSLGIRTPFKGSTPVLRFPFLCLPDLTLCGPYKIGIKKSRVFVSHDSFLLRELTAPRTVLFFLSGPFSLSFYVGPR